MSAAEEEETGTTATFAFDAAFQRKIVAHVMRDEMFMRRANDLVAKEYFEDEGLQWLAGYAADHYRRFEQTPSSEIVINDIKALKAAGRIKSETLEAVVPHLKFIYGPSCDLSNRDYMVEKVAEFAKRQAMETAIIKAAELLDKGGDVFDQAKKLVEEAAQVGAIDDGVHYEFWSAAEQRQEARVERLRSGIKTGITTGVKELDEALAEGGWGRGELSVLMGPPKAGKSIGLGEFAINASMAGYNVLYLSLENSARIVGDRMDANASEVRMRDLMTTSAVARTISSKAVSAGKLWIHEFPTGMMRPQDVRRLVRKYQSMGHNVDLIVIDYADIMAPDYRTGAENTDSKQVYTAIRAIGQQENCAILTATQTNRDGAKATVAKFTDVSEDINRVRLADVFIILAATDQEKADDVFRLYMAAMRNSESGVMFTCKSDRARMKFIKKIEKSAL